MNQPETGITVIVPAYNEGGKLATSLREMVYFLGNNRYSYEVIVVDDGSTDSTYDIARQAGAEVPRLTCIRHPKNLGKGMAVKTGFLAAEGDIVFFTDADHSTPIEEVPKFLSFVHKGYDIVVGSRALPDSVITRHQPWLRENMGNIFNYLVRLIAVRRIRDTQCGFKCFHRKRCTPVFALQRLSGFCFDVELLFLARMLNLQIAEVPVTWRNSSDTRVSTFKDSARMFRDLLLIRYNQLSGKYRRSLTELSTRLDLGESGHPA